MSSAIVPVRSDRANVPVAEIVSRPRRRWVLPLRPRRFAIGVILLESVLLAKSGLDWKDSLRRMRW